MYRTNNVSTILSRAERARVRLSFKFLCQSKKNHKHPSRPLEVPIFMLIKAHKISCFESSASQQPLSSSESLGNTMHSVNG